MSDVIKTWERKRRKSTLSRIIGKAKKQPPLKEKISYTIYKLKVQNSRLDQAYQRMQHHFSSIFSKCTNAVSAKDSMRAKIYANECAEIRKMLQTIVRSQFAIEQVVLRLETIEEFGDIAVEMNPVAGVIQSIRGPLVGVVPEVSFKLGEIGDTLNDMVVESGGVTGMSWNVTSSGTEAEKILGEANAIAEQKMQEKFPKLAEMLSLEKPS